MIALNIWFFLLLFLGWFHHENSSWKLRKYQLLLLNMLLLNMKSLISLSCILYFNFYCFLYLNRSYGRFVIMNKIRHFLGLYVVLSFALLSFFLSYVSSNSLTSSTIFPIAQILLTMSSSVFTSHGICKYISFNYLFNQPLYVYEIMFFI